MKTRSWILALSIVVLGCKDTPVGPVTAPAPKSAPESEPEPEPSPAILVSAPRFDAPEGKSEARKLGKAVRAALDALAAAVAPYPGVELHGRDLDGDGLVDMALRYGVPNTKTYLKLGFRLVALTSHGRLANFQSDDLWSGMYDAEASRDISEKLAEACFTKVGERLVYVGVHADESHSYSDDRDTVLGWGLSLAALDGAPLTLFAVAAPDGARHGPDASPVLAAEAGVSLLYPLGRYMLVGPTVRGVWSTAPVVDVGITAKLRLPLGDDLMEIYLTPQVGLSFPLKGDTSMGWHAGAYFGNQWAFDPSWAVALQLGLIHEQMDGQPRRDGLRFSMELVVTWFL